MIFILSIINISLFVYNILEYQKYGMQNNLYALILNALILIITVNYIYDNYIKKGVKENE